MMNDIRKIIAENLKAIRTEKKLTQEQLAELAGVQFRTIGYIEQKRNFASSATLNRIIEVLDISTHHLFIDNSLYSDTQKQKIEKINALLLEFDSEKLDTLYKIISVLKNTL